MRVVGALLLIALVTTVAHTQPLRTGQTTAFIATLSFRESRNATTNAVTVPTFRAVFCRTSTAWAPIGQEANCRAPTNGAWTMLRNGQSLGALSTRSNRIVSSMASIPRIAVGDERFESWLGAVHDRPLALTTARDVRETEGWMVSRLSTNERAIFARAFRASVVLPHCDVTPRGVTPPADDQFTELDISVRKVLRSAAGQLLVGLAIDEQRKPCDDVRDPARTEHWFITRGDEAPHFIGNEMHVVDAFDFDSDGRTEWLFSLSRYNEDGFILFFDAFRKSVQSTWHYH